MILPLHITIALISLVLATITYITPSAAKLNASYAFIALTLISGSALVLNSPATLLHTCVAGILYVSAATVAVVFARRKLSRLQTH